MATEQETVQDERIPQPGDPDFKPMPHADDDELVEARKAAEAESSKLAEGEGEEEGEGEGEGSQPAPQADAAKPDGAAAGQTQAGAKQTPMIPHPRFKEAVEAAYWRGRAEAAESLARRPAGAQPDGDKQPTPEEQIAAIDQETDEAAKKYDAGEISFAQYKQVERANERKIAELSRPAAQPAGDQVAMREDLYLAERTDKLPEEFPILLKLTAADIDPLVPLAYREAARDGVEITPDGRGDYTLRRYVAQIATRLHGDGAPAQRPSNQPPAENPSQAGRKKVDLAARMPPDLNRLGGRSTVADPLAPERVKDMDVDDIAALPDSARRKIAGY